MNKTFTEKLGFVMKICASQMILSLAFCGLSFAFDSHAQVLEKEISLSFTDAPLQEILNDIAAKAQVKFAYGLDQIDLNEKISIQADKQPLKGILMELFDKRDIKFVVHENESIIALKKTTSDRKGKSDKSGGSQTLLATPSFQVSGMITDGNKQPIAGANVLVKGTTNGTTSDLNGGYTVMAESNDVLVFSFIGYIQIEVAVNNQSVINVVLNEENKSLNEIVINAGYYKIESKEQTGNIGRVTAKEIENQPVTNPLQALQGRIAGVQVTQNSGVPGSGFTVRIRGTNSLRGADANDPLYIIDGVPFSSTSLFSAGNSIAPRSSPLNSLNPSDIESIEILKDADATAIYGSRGANGVVLVTTKKGKSGRSKLDLNFYTGVANASRQMDLLNTSQYVQMRKEAFKNDGIIPTVDNAPDLLLWDTTRNTNWQKILTGGTAHTNNLQANFSGGNASTQFLIGAGIYNQTSVFPGDYGYQKQSSHLRVSHALPNDKLVMDLSASFIADNNKLPTADFTSLALSLPPDTPGIYDANGNLNWENATWSNPYGDMRKTYQTTSKNLIANLNLTYLIIPGLRLKANIGYNFMSTREKNITPIASQNPAFNPLGRAIFNNGLLSTWIAEPQLDYEKTIGQSRITALVGMTFQESIRDRQGVNSSGYTNDAQLENLAAAPTIVSFGTEYSQYKYNAVFGRVNYTYQDRYIINLTARRDGSSRFGPDNRFSNFGAIGGAWIFSKENFLKGSSVVSFGKLRGSFGITGSDQIGDYQYLDTHVATTFNYQGGKGLIPTRLVNPSFGWEDNRKFEVGLELGFFNDRLFFSSSYFDNRSSNQLVGLSLPAITGFTSVQSNLPATIRNSGLELVLSWSNTKTATLQWNSSVNITLPQNKLLSYPNIESSTYANTYSVGKSIYVQKKYKSLGVDPQTGLYVFEDLDNNGSLNNVSDTQFLKEKTIDYYGGFQNTLTYKGFELQFLIQFVKQTGINYLASSYDAPGTISNQPTYVLDRWRQPGDISNVQRFTQGGSAYTAFTNASGLGDGTLSDASFVRLQNVSFSWKLPDNWISKIGSQNVRFYCQGQNLFMLTDYKGADPEIQSAVILSPLRVFTFGVQLTF